MTDALDMLPDRPRKGRGAVSNQSGRYEALQRVAVDDGWSEQERERQEPLRTLVHEDRSRGIGKCTRDRARTGNLC